LFCFTCNVEFIAAVTNKSNNNENVFKFDKENFPVRADKLCVTANDQSAHPPHTIFSVIFWSLVYRGFVLSGFETRVLRAPVKSFKYSQTTFLIQFFLHIFLISEQIETRIRHKVMRNSTCFIFHEFSLFFWYSKNIILVQF